MHIETHSLHGNTPGTHREVVSFHYGPAEFGRKVYIQSSLHADELPGMLVAHHLRRRLSQLESAGSLRAEIVVVPVANPIGLAQAVLRTGHGRFDLQSGENFNRHYEALFAQLVPLLDGKLSPDAKANMAAVRDAMRMLLRDHAPGGELAALRRVLLRLACDADIVLDLHCDTEAVVHLYTGTPLWPDVELLARYLGAHATLLATESGDNPFDEACSQTWWQLAEHFKGRFPIPLACTAVTVELRGLAAVEHGKAAADSQALIDYLISRGMIAGTPKPPPPLVGPATPLAGSEALHAPVSGVVVFLKEPGDWIKPGDDIVEIIDPISEETVRLKSSVEGVLYARDNQRFAFTGARLAKIAGPTPIRTGKLLSA